MSHWISLLSLTRQTNDSRIVLRRFFIKLDTTGDEGSPPISTFAKLEQAMHCLSRPSRKSDDFSQMGLDDLQAADVESSSDAGAAPTCEDGEDARDRDFANSRRWLSLPEDHNSGCFHNSLLFISEFSIFK
jgi:hypothetical protein